MPYAATIYVYDKLIDKIVHVRDADSRICWKENCSKLCCRPADYKISNAQQEDECRDAFVISQPIDFYEVTVKLKRYLIA